MTFRGSAIGLVLALLGTAASLHGQNETDAYRYMTPSSVGTARVLGLGGAASAMGADYSAAYLNPAGLALYRKSDFMITPGLRVIGNKAAYLGENSNNSYNKFGFTNLGYVYAGRVNKWNSSTRTLEESEKGLKSYAFTVGLNQTAQLGRNTRIEGYNNQNSITQYFAGLANGYTAAELDADGGYAGQAWWAYAIDTSGQDGNYIGAANGGNVMQNVDVFEIGRTNEWNVGFAGNVNDKIYFGGALGIQDIRYSTELTFQENDINNLHNTWNNDSTPYTSSTFVNGFTTRGSGINLRLGVIGKPTDYLRLGLSVATPTIFNMTDSYYANMVGYLDGDPSPKSKGEDSEGVFSYNLTTPFKVTVGGMVLFGKRGFITADLDYTDYSTAKYKSSAKQGSAYYYSFRTENDAMRDLFAGAVNMRIGGELRFGPGRARAGVAQYGSILKKAYLNYYEYPSNEVKKLVGGKQLFSLGLGIKQKSFYLDLAFVHETAADRRLLYTLPDVNAYSPELINKISTNNLYMTIGFTF